MLEALLGTAADRHADMVNIVSDLQDEALGWRPAEAASSMAGLVLHILHLEATALSIAMGGAAEFGENGAGTEDFCSAVDLVAGIDRIQDELGRTFRALSASRLQAAQPGEERTIAAMLVEEFDHAAMHYGQLQLTRHLWEAANPRAESSYSHWR